MQTHTLHTPINLQMKQMFGKQTIPNRTIEFIRIILFGRNSGRIQCTQHSFLLHLAFISELEFQFECRFFVINWIINWFAHKHTIWNNHFLEILWTNEQEKLNCGKIVEVLNDLMHRNKIFSFILLCIMEHTNL